MGYAKAKHLRKNMTEAETLLWEQLRASRLGGYKFRRQHPIGIYIADFYCHQKKLAIELDGRQHNQPAAQEYDNARTRQLQLSQIKVLRFTNQQVLKHLDQIIEEVAKELDRR